MLRKMRDNLTNAIASRHVAGSELDDALRICRWAESEGFRTVISPWSGPQEDSRKMFDLYAAALGAVGTQSGLCYLSIKLDAIGYDEGMFRDLIYLARLNAVRLHIDSLGPDTADTALRFVEKAAASFHQIGYTLASRWHRSLTDAERVAELGTPVRIVKGQWEDPLWRGLDCRKNYLDIAGKLAGRCGEVGIATHDIPLAREVLTRLLYDETNCELEQFFSLPLNGETLARKLQCPYRIYVAYGHPGIPYNVRFTLTRPRIAAWVFADFAFHPRRPWLRNLV